MISISSEFPRGDEAEKPLVLDKETVNKAKDTIKNLKKLNKEEGETRGELSGIIGTITKKYNDAIEKLITENVEDNDTGNRNNENNDTGNRNNENNDTGNRNNENNDTGNRNNENKDNQLIINTTTTDSPIDYSGESSELKPVNEEASEIVKKLNKEEVKDRIRDVNKIFKKGPENNKKILTNIVASKEGEVKELMEKNKEKAD